MALLGKTLKGRSTKPGGSQTAQTNVQVKEVYKTQEQIEQFKKESKLIKDHIKEKMEVEQKITDLNKKKLLTYWRKILRLSKTETLKNDIDVISQSNQRELDSKEALLQMLDKNLEESEEQYQIILRNHLIHLSHLRNLQNNRIMGLSEEFENDVKILSNEFYQERSDLFRSYKAKEKELEDLIQTVKDEDRKKILDAESEHQQNREETRNRNMEDTNHMKMLLEAKQTTYYNSLEQLHQQYQSDTAKNKNKDDTKKIDQYVRNIANKRANIELMRLKILSHRKECESRNAALKKEKDNIARSYTELKKKMLKFREEEERRLTELVTNSRNAVKKLSDYSELGEKILKTAELCRRLETEKEKVLPFYNSSVDEITEIPEDLRTVFEEITEEQYQEFSYLNNFYKRYNKGNKQFKNNILKVLLDKLAIEKQKHSLQKENLLLKNLLKQYLDGISLNDDVLKNNNPLMVINDKIDISRPPVEKENKTVIEGAFVVQNIALQKSNIE